MDIPHVLLMRSLDFGTMLLRQLSLDYLKDSDDVISARTVATKPRQQSR